MENNEIRLKFGGDNHYIDTNTLIAELTHITTVINQVNSELGGGTRKIKINVNAIEKGSFIVDLAVVESVFKTIFSEQGIEHLANVATVVGSIFGLYKFFKGRKLTEVDEPQVKNIIQGNNNNIVNGNVTINNYINIYNDVTTRRAVSSTFKAAVDDGNIDSINIDTPSAKIDFPKENFAELTYDDFDKEDNVHEEKDVSVDAILTIKQLNFERNNDWKFIYEGNEIKMKIKDGPLMQQIDNGARFGKGDKIKAVICIHKVWNDTYNCYENKKYSIVEFHGIIPNIQQQKIEF